MRFASSSDHEICRKIHRQHGTTYYFSTLRFPLHVRQRVHAVYAFVRVPDEWVDNPGSLTLEEQTRLIDDWRMQMRRGLAGERPEHPVMRAFCDVGRKHNLPIGEVESFLDSMKMDITVTRYPTYRDLQGYMNGSACAVGVMMCHAMGARLDEDTLSRARALGEAMQLTNFLRDVGEDFRRGRIYLPLDEMARFGTGEHDIASSNISKELLRSCRCKFIERGACMPMLIQA